MQLVVAGQPHAGKAEAFLVDRRRVGRDAAGDRAADIEEMGHRDAVGDQRTAVEDRPDDREVAGMRPALEGIVGEERVARRHVGAEALQDELHLPRECAGEDGDAIGLGDQFAARVADAAGEVEHLVDHRTHRRSREHDRHLVDGSEQLAVDDFLRDRVGGSGRSCRRRLPDIQAASSPHSDIPQWSDSFGQFPNRAKPFKLSI